MPTKSTRLSAVLLCSVLLSAHLLLLPRPVSAQEPEEEIVANLALGRVVVCVAKDGIVIGAQQSQIEAHSHPPLVVPLSSRRVAVLLGAAEWVRPASGRGSLRLDRELPRLVGQITGPRRLEQEHASDIEEIGLALLERLRDVAQQLHRKVELQPEEPLIEVLLVGYVEDYGPEVWSMRYRIMQEPLRGDYWRTRVLRPSYTQLYPPEKGQPRTLIEIHHPPQEPWPTLLELLSGNDPRLARLRAADTQTARATEQLARGESHQALLADATQFLRAALRAVAPPDAEQIFAIIQEQRGFEWILAPSEPPQKVDQAQPREPGAPTLRKKP